MGQLISGGLIFSIATWLYNQKKKKKEIAFEKSKKLVVLARPIEISFGWDAPLIIPYTYTLEIYNPKNFEIIIKEIKHMESNVDIAKNHRIIEIEKINPNKILNISSKGNLSHTIQFSNKRSNGNAKSRFIRVIDSDDNYHDSEKFELNNY